ncbi:MAG: SRPBCC family protein [Candidatus Hermodarchaeota archaeon]
MPKVERKIEINASPNIIYNCITDISLIRKWNSTIKEIIQTGPNEGSIRSTGGDYTYATIERKENEMVTSKAEAEQFTSFGYVLKAKGDLTEVSSWIDYKIVEHEEILGRGIIYILNDLKNFAEYLEDGGDPGDYDRKKILVSP